MRILAIERFDVNIHRGMGGESLEKLAHEFGIEIADLGLREFCPENQKRPAGNIHRDPRQSLVHRQEHIREPCNSRHVTQGLADRLTQSYAGILDSMMLVDMEIARRVDLDIDQRMARELLQHMVEKADAGCDIGKAGAVESDADHDIGFLGFSRNGAGAHGCLENCDGFLSTFKATGVLSGSRNALATCRALGYPRGFPIVAHYARPSGNPARCSLQCD